MEKKKQLTCGFQLARNGKMCRCGKPATHRFKDAPLCNECASYVQGRGELVLPISTRFLNKALKQQELPGGAA